MDITIRDIEANGMTFRCREAGTSGEPVLMLHGFPETSHMWTHVMPQIVAAGYRCLAPDGRGYSPGARPDGVDAYTYEHLRDDALAIADVWGVGRFHLAGHDWGALAGWYIVAHDDARRVASWSALSVPHNRGFAEAVWEDPAEERYRGFLNLLANEGVAETTFAANDFALPKMIWTGSSADEIAEYVDVFSQPGALTGAMNWYRASRLHKRALEDGVVPDVATPSLLIWGKNDQAISRVCVDNGAKYVKGPFTFLELDAGHWLTQEKTAEVAAAMIAHLRANSLAAYETEPALIPPPEPRPSAPL